MICEVCKQNILDARRVRGITTGIEQRTGRPNKSYADYIQENKDMNKEEKREAILASKSRANGEGMHGICHI